MKDKELMKIIVSFGFFVLGFFVSGLFSFFCFLFGYLIVGGEVIWKAIQNVLHGNFFDEAFLMTVATIGAFIIGEYPEGVAVMLFFQLGEYLQEKAISKSRRDVLSLMDLKSDFVHVKKDGSFVKVDPKEVQIDDEFIVYPGEKVALDGIVVDGVSSLDVKALTGESGYCDVGIGDVVLSGSVNQQSVLVIRATQTYDQSTVSKILDLIEHASERKAVTEKFITRFSKIYTPFVVVIAILLTVIPVFVFHGLLSTWLYRSIVFLVISCPCALVLSIPLSFFCGIGKASKMGVLVKGSKELDMLTKLKAIAFDKTGTLTNGDFKVLQVVSYDDTIDIGYIGALLESNSKHPVARAICNYYSGSVSFNCLTDFVEEAGKGVSGVIDGVRYFVGNDKYLNERGIDVPEVFLSGTVIYVMSDRLLGYFVIGDTLKDEIESVVSRLKLDKVIMSGDREANVKMIADTLQVSKWYSELLPQDKVSVMERLIKDYSMVAFVGDGMNDAPVLRLASVGISMGGIGSDAAIESSDIVIMNDDLEKISDVIDLACYTKRIIWFNIIFSLFVKFVILLLGAFGFASIWMAVFSDVGVTLLAVLNSLRILRYKNKK